MSPVRTARLRLTAILTVLSCFEVHNAAAWQIAASMNGRTITGAVTITASGQSKTVPIVYVKICGVSWDGSAATKLSRRDDAGFSPFDSSPVTGIRTVIVGGGRYAEDLSEPFDIGCGERPGHFGRERGFYYEWNELEIVLIETDCTPPLAAGLEGLAPNAAAAEIAFVMLAEAGQFETLAKDVDYKIGAIRVYDGVLYRCIQSHTSLAGWEPPETASLWIKIAGPPDKRPEWGQPVGGA